MSFWCHLKYFLCKNYLYLCFSSISVIVRTSCIYFYITIYVFNTVIIYQSISVYILFTNFILKKWSAHWFPLITFPAWRQVCVIQWDWLRFNKKSHTSRALLQKNLATSEMVTAHTSHFKYSARAALKIEIKRLFNGSLRSIIMSSDISFKLPSLCEYTVF